MTGREAGAAALIVALILYGSLYPFRFDFGRALHSPLWILLHSWPARFDRFAFRDGASNVMLYLPLGFTAALAFGRRWWAALLFGMGLSAGIEMLQVYDASRTCSLFDLACNTAGTAAGTAIAMAWPRKRREEWFTGRERLKAGAMLVAACWAGYQLYPFVPLVSRGHLHASWAQFLTAPISWVEVFANAAEWFAAALLVGEVLGRGKAWVLSVAMLALPLRLLLADRSLTLAEVLGGAAALILWAAIPEKIAGKAGALLMAMAIVVRELAPFAFAANPHAFSWAPFAATFAADRMPAVLVMFHKAFDYGAMIWLLRKKGTVRAGLAVAAALFAMEWAQRYLPGRQAEITDSLLALLVTIPLVWDRRR